MRSPTPIRARLMQGASLVCLGLFGAGPASAQLAALRAMTMHDLPANAVPAPGANLGSVSLLHDQGSAVARQLATQMRLANSIGLVTQAQVAARAAAAALSSSVPNGLVTGGLQLAPNSGPAAQDKTGLATLQGALAPTQSASGGATTVTVTQTDSRAVLSWTTFNIGQNTTVNFNQKANGVVQKDWVAFNRVVGQYDPATGRRDPTLAPAPSQILGRLNCDASCIVINPNGVFFGPTSQVNAGSLLVSTLEFGAPSQLVGTNGAHAPRTLSERTGDFLRAGLIAAVSNGPAGGGFSASDVQSGTDAIPEPLLEGDIRTAQGAQITIGDAGLLFAAAPHVVNAGTLSASNGQIGLSAGRAAGFTIADPAVADQVDIRGLVFTSSGGSDAYIVNSGILSSARGYVSLQAGAGAVLQQGILESTTSVSRNGFIDIGAPDVQLAPGSTIAITPDTNGETIPQSPTSVAAFRTSRVRIASTTPIGGAAGGIEVGANALVYAPGGRVSLGLDPNGQIGAASRVFIDSGATIDVGGIKDFAVPASRNQVTISPAKKNELRDTPNYRQSFLNGATIYVDPRRSGVRADGVAWVGSPLVEAGSFYQNVGVTAAELLTKGGQVTIGTAPFIAPNGGKPTAPVLSSDVTIKPGAIVDVSGGWVTYQAGQVQTSQLITSGGQIVDIGNADPNGDYVGLVNPFTTTNTRFGITNQFPNGTLQGVTNVAQYTEGRDAGALAINAPTIALDGLVYGQAYAGSVQRANAVVGTAKSSIARDLRALQAVPTQLPSGARLAIDPPTVAPGTTFAAQGAAGDIAIVPSAAIPTVANDLTYGQSISLDATGALVRPTMRDPASLLPTARHDTILLSDSALSGMGLGELTLGTTGALSFAAGTVTTLAPGGVLDANVGRSIHVDGNVSAPGGTIALQTFAVGQDKDGFSPRMPGVGSIFANEPAAPGSFDIIVNGMLSARGRFINDFKVTPDSAEGGAFTRGGSVTIIGAPDVRLTTSAIAQQATDISGSILLDPGSLVDVSGGALVSATGSINTGARGGSVSLVEQTTYAQLANIYTGNPNFLEIRGLRLLFPSTLNPTGAIAVNPGAITARVSVAPGTIRAHGFAGGGTFTLTTPDFSFGDAIASVGTELPLNFLGQTGFANASVSVFKTSLTPNRFTNGLGGFNSTLQTDTVTIGSGQTLLLAQSQFSPLLTTQQTLAVQALGNGDDLYTVLTPSVPIAAYDQRPISLTFSGLVELDVAAGGRIDGAVGAGLTASKILDEGTIRLPGGNVVVNEMLPGIYADTGLAPPIYVTDLSQVFSANADGSISQNAPNALGLQGNQGILSNVLLAFQRPIVLVGRLGGTEGLRVAAGGVIDVSGIALFNPRATAPNGSSILDGVLSPGGTIASLAGMIIATPVAVGNLLENLNRVGQSLEALPGSTLDLSGVSASFDRLNAAGAYMPTPQWSNGGTLSLEGGSVSGAKPVLGAGSISGATIRAGGGAPAATGGTLVVLDPVLAQADDPARTTNVIAANAVQAAGFSTFVGEGALTTNGPVDLVLNRAFFAQSRPYDGGAVPNDSPLFNVQIGAIGALHITAPLIRLAGIAQSVPDNTIGLAGTASATFTASTLDVQGAVIFDQSLSSVTLAATQDLRLIGVQPLGTTLGLDLAATPSLQGQLLASGDLTLSAAQVYPTTGTTFTVASSGAKSTIRIVSPGGAAPATPYSAGTNLTVQAANIEQAGVLRAPLGTLTLGSNTPLTSTSPTSGFVETLAPATTSLHLAKGSITSVSADGLSIPYGITTDQVEYFFTPTVSAELTAPPAALLRLAGTNVALDGGATVNLKGGGDVFAFEFVPGTGGSRDVLDRFNTDAFSSRNNFQYPDARQVYAIVPGLNQANLALNDPIYSADYGALTSTSQIGRQVYLDASPGLAAGYYTLLPAHYALLPGGLRVVEQPEYGTPVPGRSTQLRDGTTIVDGYYGTANTGLHESMLRTFSVQTQATFKNASLIATTSADTVFPARAARNGLTSPRIPLDAGRLVINAITGITADAMFETAAAPGGRAASTDISGSNFLIVGAAPAATSTAALAPGTIVVTTGTLEALNSASLLIGGTRTDNADGTTNLFVSANTITVANDASTNLTAPELLFAVAGAGSSVRLADGASVAASGALGDTRTGDYILDGASGAGALVRLSTGPERVARRTNVASVATAPLLNVGLAHLAATSLLLDSSGDLRIASPATGAADIAANQIAIGAGAVAFTGTARQAGLSITPQLQAAFAKAATLTIRSPQAISFAGGSYAFGALTLDTPALALLGDAGAVALTTGALRLQNSATQLATCAPACGTGTLGIGASTISFGSGQIRAIGFGGGVSLSAPGGVTFDGANNSNSAMDNGLAGFDVGTAPLAIATPFLGDRALALKPGQSAVLPSLALTTTGALTFTGVSGATVAAVAIAPTVAGTPGARLALSGDKVSITDTQVVATAGALDVRAASGIALAGTASLSTPGYSKIFGDATDPTTVSAPGGLLTLTAANGAIDLGAGTRLSVGGAQGQAGELRIVAANGAVNANGVLDAAAPDGGGLFTLVTRGGFDLGKFASGAARGFDQRIDIRVATGDLSLAAGQSLISRVVRLTADGGADSIAGTIDTSGINGGQIALYGETGVSLAPTGKLLARASGYGATDSRQAKGGDITIGTDGTGAITLAAGSTIDLSAVRPGDRLVTDVHNGTTYYRVAAGDVGGTLAIRAPIVGAAGATTVNVNAAGTVTGARDVVVEGFKRFDLAAIAADPTLTGVTVANGTATLNVGQTSTGRLNFLGDVGAGTIPTFVQTFDISAAAPALKGLGTYRADPGIELSYGGNITLASNWNLGAGTVDIAGAAAAGLAVRNPITGSYAIVPGQEGAVFSRFTKLTYRVGGKVDGEPGVLTLRAGGDLTIGTNTTCATGTVACAGAASITDGFFAFRDQTTREGIDVSYGGGSQQVAPTLQPGCPNGGDCTKVTAFDPTTLDTAIGNAILIDFAGTPGPSSTPIGQSPIPALPYNADANSPSAGKTSGDPLGTAVIFPRLDDGRAVRSFSYTLVGGAELAVNGKPSVDPAAVNAASAGKVIVQGESSYAVNPRAGGNSFTNQLLISVSPSNTGAIPVVSGAFASAFGASQAGKLAFGQNSATTITLQDANGPSDPGSQYLVAQAQAFFAAHSGQSSFLLVDGIDPNTGNLTSPQIQAVSTTLALASQFLTTIAVGYGQQIANGTTGDVPAFQTIIQPARPFNYVRTRVRTGTGNIAIAAAGDIDTTNGPAVFRSAGVGSGLLQVGGTAIYTAGTTADLSRRSIVDPATGLARAIDTSAYAQTATIFSDTTQTPLVDALIANPLYLDQGGSVRLSAGNDVLGLRDGQGNFRILSENGAHGRPFIGASDAPFRVGHIGLMTDIRANPQLFQTGVATLGGGDILVTAGRDVQDLTITANTSVTTADVTGGGVTPTLALVTKGGGNVSVSAGRDIVSGLYDIGEGTLVARVARDITSTGRVAVVPPTLLSNTISNALRVRVADATASIEAGGRITVRDILAFGVSTENNSSDPVVTQGTLGFYTPVSSFAARSNAAFTLESYGDELNISFKNGFKAAVLPGSLSIASLTGDLNLAPDRSEFLFLFPSSVGQLHLFAGGNLLPVTIDMDDGDPGLLPGYFSSSVYLTIGRTFTFPTVISTTSDTDRRSYHNAFGPTHAGDAEPARIAVGGTVDSLILNTPKQTRVSAGQDILNSAVFAQNLSASDVTRVSAGRDIVATSAIGQAYGSDPKTGVLGPIGSSLPYAQGNTFVIGGPGAFYLEAGRDAGPFLTSVSAAAYGADGSAGPVETLGGGVLSVGNEWNPYLAPIGANVTVQFGVAHGVNYGGFRDIYLDPANVANLPDDQFAQIVDQYGRSNAIRSEPIYAPVLLTYVQTHAAAELLAAYGTTEVTVAQAYAVFKALSPLRQRELVQQVYFNELTQTSIPTSVSYLKYARGYRAVNLLFPPAVGYTKNDLSGGGNTGTVPIETGNLDLRLATIQTSRGGNIDIFGPGGRVLGGSTVRTSAQAARRLTISERIYSGGDLNLRIAPIIAIPTGYEGFLTLRGGAIHGFVDLNFLLNQSRLFTQGGGDIGYNDDIALWSSNGDLNAGQGPKTSANFPPVVVRVGPNGNSEVDAVSGVTGAGIAAFQRAPGLTPPNVYLIAPRGTVDAGDAGVRVAGNLFVAALAVANADNFAVGGTAFGIPSGPVVNTAATAAAGASTAAAIKAADTTSRDASTRRIDPLSRIIVDVLGYYGSADPCDQASRKNCPAAR